MRDTKKIAVTGGAGFIGSHLVDRLLSMGKAVTVFDNFATGTRENLKHHAHNSKLTIVEGDVRHYDQVERALAGVDAVFHLATHCVRLSLTDPRTNHDVNATGTLNCLMAAQKGGVKRFVYCSSSEVYGNAAATLGRAGGLLDEESPKLPTTVYGSSKLVGEHYTLAFHQTHGLPCVVARPFNTYGPREHLTGPFGEVIPRFAVWLKAGVAPLIFSDGTQTRDFTYVEDTAAGLVAVAECDSLLGSSVNLARGEELSIRHLAELLGKLIGSSVSPRFVSDRPGDIQRLGANTEKAKRVLPPGLFTTSIEMGLKKYLTWLDGQRLDYQKAAQALTQKNWTEPTRDAAPTSRKFAAAK